MTAAAPRRALAAAAAVRRMSKSEAMRMPRPRVGSRWRELRSGRVHTVTGTRGNAPVLVPLGRQGSGHRVEAHDVHMFYEPL